MHIDTAFETVERIGDKLVQKLMSEGSGLQRPIVTAVEVDAIYQVAYVLTRQGINPESVPMDIFHTLVERATEAAEGISWFHLLDLGIGEALEATIERMYPTCWYCDGTIRNRASFIAEARWFQRVPETLPTRKLGFIPWGAKTVYHLHKAGWVGPLCSECLAMMCEHLQLLKLNTISDQPALRFLPLVSGMDWKKADLDWREATIEGNGDLLIGDWPTSLSA